MTAVFKDFPDLNIRMHFDVSWNSIPGSLGCHSGALSAISLVMNYTRPYSYIDTEATKSKEFKDYTFSIGNFGGLIASPGLAEAMKAKIKDKPITWEDFPEGYKALLAACKSTPMWFISDVVNYRAPERGIASFQHFDPYGASTQLKPALQIQGRTCDFATWLMEKEHGYIYASPLVQNPMHRRKGDYSINRAWVWIHPNHIDRCIDISEEVGLDKLPSKEKVLSAYQTDLGFSNPVYCETRVFDDGRFPERRFKGRKAA